MIIHSAILFCSDKYTCPIIVSGKRHSDCFNRAHELGIEYDKDKIIQGFITDKFAFLDRYEAKYEARKCNQLLKDDGSRELFSDDI